MRTVRGHWGATGLALRSFYLRAAFVTPGKETLLLPCLTRDPKHQSPVNVPSPASRPAGSSCALRRRLLLPCNPPDLNSTALLLFQACSCVVFPRVPVSGGGQMELHVSQLSSEAVKSAPARVRAVRAWTVASVSLLGDEGVGDYFAAVLGTYEHQERSACDDQPQWPGALVPLLVWAGVSGAREGAGPEMTALTSDRLLHIVQHEIHKRIIALEAPSSCPFCQRPQTRSTLTDVRTGRQAYPRDHR